MIRVKVEYDAYNRIFKLREREFGTVLEDGAFYELVVPIMADGLKEEDDLATTRASIT